MFEFEGNLYNVIPIIGDGSCLFSSLSVLLFGTTVISLEIRQQIVEYVVSNWERFRHYVVRNEQGDIFQSADEYCNEMNKRTTYGTFCEIQAAADLYMSKFTVFSQVMGEWIATNFVPHRELASTPWHFLLLSGDSSNGHFDVLDACEKEPPKKRRKRFTNEPGKQQKKVARENAKLRANQCKNFFF